MRNSNITAISKTAKAQPTKKRKAALTVNAATVKLKRARISSDSDEHDAPTLSDKSDGTVL